MFLFSKEEPVTNNESLYKRRNIKGQLELDQSKGLAINRYCFVNKNDNIGNEFKLLLGELFKQLNTKIFIVLSWLVQIPGKSKVASKVIKKKYEKSNWTIFTKDTHYIAIKEILYNDINDWPPLGAGSSDGGSVIILGNYGLHYISNIINDEDSIFLAKNKYFAPDTNFLLRLKKQKALALYQVDDEFGNMGLVLVGEGRVRPETFTKTISFSQIYEGESAYKIFII